MGCIRSGVDGWTKKEITFFDKKARFFFFFWQVVFIRKVTKIDCTLREPIVVEI